MRCLLWIFAAAVVGSQSSDFQRQSSDACPESDVELDELEGAEAEQAQLLDNLHLLQTQTSLQQRSLLAVHGNATEAATASSNATSTRGTAARRDAPVQPLGVYTKSIGAPDIYWAVASLCFAAFVTCGALVMGSWFFCKVRPKHEHPSLAFKVFVGLFLAAVVAGALWLAVWYFAGAIIKKWLMAYDTSFLGVEVEVDRIALNPWFGIVAVRNLTVGNPEGYTSEHLAKVGDLFVDLNMGDIVKSLGHRITVDQAHVRGVDVVFEQALTTSNVEDVLNHLGVIAPQGPSKGHSKGFKVDLHVHEVRTSDVWVRAKFALQGMQGISTKVPNITWKDFDTEVKPNSADECVVIILATLLDNAKRLMR